MWLVLDVVRQDVNLVASAGRGDGFRFLVWDVNLVASAGRDENGSRYLVWDAFSTRSWTMSMQTAILLMGRQGQLAEPWR